MAFCSRLSTAPISMEIPRNEAEPCTCGKHGNQYELRLQTVHTLKNRKHRNPRWYPRRICYAELRWVDYPCNNNKLGVGAMRGSCYDTDESPRRLPGR